MNTKAFRQPATDSSSSSSSAIVQRSQILPGLSRPIHSPIDRLSSKGVLLQYMRDVYVNRIHEEQDLALVAVVAAKPRRCVPPRGFCAEAPGLPTALVPLHSCRIAPDITSSEIAETKDNSTARSPFPLRQPCRASSKASTRTSTCRKASQGEQNR